MHSKITTAQELADKLIAPKQKMEKLLERNYFISGKLNSISEYPIFKMEETINRKLGFTEPAFLKKLDFNKNLDFDRKVSEILKFPPKSALEVAFGSTKAFEIHMSAASVLGEAIKASNKWNSLEGTAVGELKKLAQANEKLYSPLSEVFKRIAVDLSMTSTDYFDTETEAAFDLIDEDNEIKDKFNELIDKTRDAKDEFAVTELKVAFVIWMYKTIFGKKVDFQKLYLASELMGIFAPIVFSIYFGTQEIININTEVKNYFNQIEVDSIPEQIRQLWELKEQGIITGKEFEKSKSELLDSL